MPFEGAAHKICNAEAGGRSGKALLKVLHEGEGMGSKMANPGVTYFMDAP